MIVDVFNHFYPKEYLDALPRPLRQSATSVTSTMRAIADLEYRIGQMDKFGVDMEVLSLPTPTLDDLVDVPVSEFPRIMRAGSDGISRIVEQSHGRFRGIATVSLLDVDAAMDEAERAIRDLGFIGVQVLSNVRGKPLDSPEFEPFYAKLSQLGGGIWIHPANMRKIYDWMNDEYNMNMMMGWGIDTSLAMFRIMRGGIFERHPNLKIVSHHMGTLIPLMAGRINSLVMGQGKNGKPPAPLTKTPMEYMKMFYIDTAEAMWKPAMALSQSFFGSSHMLLGTDYPWGDTSKIIDNIKGLNITEEEKEMILGENAISLFGIK